MQIEHSLQIDASEPDAAGSHDYYYEYEIYRFTDVALCLVARSYTDALDEAHFLRIESSEHPRLLTDADLLSPLFVAAQTYLRGIGKTQLRWLNGSANGDESVPLSPGREA
jgi:hypothetical protein